MKTLPFALAISALLALPLASFATDSSPHCNTLPASEKDQCLKDELAKTDSKAAPESAASGGSAPSAAAQDNRDRSPHCDSLPGAEKDQCLKDEAAKTDSRGPSDKK
jgi:hypothetical protein